MGFFCWWFFFLGGECLVCVGFVCLLFCWFVVWLVGFLWGLVGFFLMFIGAHLSYPYFLQNISSFSILVLSVRLYDHIRKYFDLI